MSLPQASARLKFCRPVCRRQSTMFIVVELLSGYLETLSFEKYDGVLSACLGGIGIAMLWTVKCGKSGNEWSKCVSMIIQCKYGGIYLRD